MKNKQENVRKLITAVEYIRKYDPEMQLQTLQTLLEVLKAGVDGIPMSTLSERLDISQASTSRNVAALGNKLNRHKSPGLGLLKAEEDPMDCRRKIVSTTAKGEKLFTQLADLIW